MSEKRRGLGRGLGALIPTGLDGQRPSGAERPVDVFFPDPKRDNAEATTSGATTTVTEAPPAQGTDADAATVQGRPDGDHSGSPDTVAESTDARSNGVAVNGTARDDRDADGDDMPASTDAVLTAAAGTTADQTRTATDESAAPTSGSSGGAAPGGVAADVAGDGVAASASQSGPASSAQTTDPDGLLPVPGARFAELPVGQIRPNPKQPRTVFDEDALDELVGSIREIGVLQPIVVRDAGDGYELIMGERRWRATQAAGLATVPAIIRDTDDADLLRDALLENLHRSQLNPLEEAAAYQQLLDDFGCTHEQLAARIQRSRPQISNTLRLLKLPPLVQRRVAAGVLSAGHARALLGLNDAAAIERLAQRIVAEGLSVRAVEEIVSLGGDAAPNARRAAPRAGVKNEALDHLAARLSDRFDTRVKVSLGKSRGRLTVEFASVQDLNRILESLAPEDPGLLKG